MNRVQNLSQFLQWLKERKAKRSGRSSDNPLPVSHDPDCKCRPCMKLPQIPREHRRLQKAADRPSESPDHIYEEIPPEMISSKNLLDAKNNHLDLASGYCVPTSNTETVKHLLKLKAKGLLDHKQESIHQNMDIKSNARKETAQQDKNKSNRVLSSTVDEQKAIKAEKDSSVNLGNLDFGQAKEFGGFLVVPLKDRMVFKRLDDSNPDFNCDSQPGQTKVGSLPSDLDIISKVDYTQNVVYVNQSIVPQNLAEFKQALSTHIETQNSDKVTHTRKANSGSKSAFTRYIPSAGTTCYQTNISPPNPKSRTASNPHAFYDPRRSSLSTESSEDSGGYFHGSDSKMPSYQEPDCSTLRTSDSSENSNDTYNEYDVKSDDDSSNSPEYDAFLQRAKQQRCLESQVQEMARESGSDSEYSVASNMDQKAYGSSSPLAMLDIDDILALVSSDDNRDLLTDILYQDYTNPDVQQKEIVSDLKKRISCPMGKPNRASNDLNRQTNDRLSCRVTGNHVMTLRDPEYPIKHNNNIPASKPTKARKQSQGNRVLGDLMQLNHDRQLFF